MRPDELIAIARRVARHYPIDDRDDIEGDALEQLVKRAPASASSAMTIARFRAVDYMRRKRGRGATPITIEPVDAIAEQLAAFTNELADELDVAIAIEAIRTLLYGRALAVFDALLEDWTDARVSRECDVGERHVRALRTQFQALIPPHLQPPRRYPNDAADAA